MKILDRYVLLMFLKNYLVSFAVLIGMYITLDIVMNFDELFKVAQTDTETTGLQTALRAVSAIVEYYLYQSVLIFVQLSPVIPVVAAAFTLLRMTRFNETTATLAAGVPLVRTAMPIILLGSAMSLAVLPVTQEYVIPSIIPKLLRDHEDVGREGRRSFQVKALEDAKGSILIAARFHPATLTAPASMVEVDLVERDADRQPVSHVRAASARWDAGAASWVLADGVKTMGLSPTERRATDADIDVLPTTLTPDEVILYRSREYVDLLSTARINQLLAVPRNYGVQDLLRVKHFRLTQYLNNICLLLLIIPCVMTREPRTLKTGGSFLLIVTGSFLGTIFLCQHLAGAPAPLPALEPHWIPLMALTPLLIYTPAAIYALDKIKT